MLLLNNNIFVEIKMCNKTCLDKVYSLITRGRVNCCYNWSGNSLNRCSGAEWIVAAIGVLIPSRGVQGQGGLLLSQIINSLKICPRAEWIVTSFNMVIT